MESPGERGPGQIAADLALVEPGVQAHVNPLVVRPEPGDEVERPPQLAAHRAGQVVTVVAVPARPAEDGDPLAVAVAEVGERLAPRRCSANRSGLTAGSMSRFVDRISIPGGSSPTHARSDSARPRTSATRASAASESPPARTPSPRSHRAARPHVLGRWSPCGPARQHAWHTSRGTSLTPPTPWNARSTIPHAATSRPPRAATPDRSGHPSTVRSMICVHGRPEARRPPSPRSNPGGRHLRAGRTDGQAPRASPSGRRVVRATQRPSPVGPAMWPSSPGR